MAELALDDVQRHALAQQLERMRVTQLVRREPPSHTCVSRATVQHRSRRRGAPRATARAAVDHAEQRADRHLLARSQPRLQLLEAPVVHADFAAPAAFAAPHKQRATAPVKVELGQIKRLLDRSPERQSTAIKPRARNPCSPSPQQRITAMISSVRGGSGGYRRPLVRDERPARSPEHRGRGPTAAQRVQRRWSGHDASSRFRRHEAYHRAGRGATVEKRPSGVPERTSLLAPVRKPGVARRERLEAGR